MSFFISFCKFDVTVLPNILHSFSEYSILHWFEENFFKIIFSFCSKLCVYVYVEFQPSFLIKLYYLCIFSNINPRFSTCFRAFMCMTWVFLLKKLQASFSNLLTFILFGKNGISLCSPCSSSEYLTSTSSMYPDDELLLWYVWLTNSI